MLAVAGLVLVLVLVPVLVLVLVLAAKIRSTTASKCKTVSLHSDLKRVRVLDFRTLLRLQCPQQNKG